MFVGSLRLQVPPPQQLPPVRLQVQHPPPQHLGRFNRGHSINPIFFAGKASKPWENHPTYCRGHESLPIFLGGHRFRMYGNF